MQKAANTMSVTISRFGHGNQTVNVAEGATVEAALTSAGIDLAGNEQLFVAREVAERADVLESGDTLQIVTPKQAGV